MSVFRHKPGNLVMAEAVPFGQKWTYYSDHPIEAMLDPLYFISAVSRLKSGDEIRVLQVQANKVIAFADVLVTNSSLEDKTLVFYILRQPQQVIGGEGLKTVHNFAVKRGFGCFEVRDGKGNVVYVADTKQEAIDKRDELEQAA